MNRYAYLNGNPVSYIDPFGLCEDTDRVDSGLKKIIFRFIGYAVASAIAIGAILSGGVLLGIISVVAANVGFAAYSLSDMDEGNQDVIYGAAGADIKSRNFMLDTVFAGNKTAYTICLIALTVLDWAGGKMLVSPGSAGKTASDVNEGSKTIENSSEVVDTSIDEAAADSEKMLEESGNRLALPEPEKLLELPEPETRLALPAPEAATEAKYGVGAYEDIRGVEGLDAHHVGQKAAMKNLVKNYDYMRAPAINVPKIGHTIIGPNGIVSRSIKGIDNARQLLARDIMELRRVYPDIPNSKLQELIDMNKKLYPEMRK